MALHRSSTAGLIYGRFAMSNETGSGPKIAPQEAPTKTSSVTAAPSSTKNATTSSPQTHGPSTSSPNAAPTNSPAENPQPQPPPQPPPQQAPQPQPQPQPQPASPPQDAAPTIATTSVVVTSTLSPQNPSPPAANPNPNDTTKTITNPATPDATPNVPDTPDNPPSLVTITMSQTSPGDTAVVTVIQTSTHALPSQTHGPKYGSTSTTAGLSPTSTPELQRDPSSSSESGFSGSGKIAVAVLVPIAIFTVLVLAALFLFRKRKQRKHAEELRRKEVEEYGYNPNQDPTFPVIGSGTTSNDPYEVREENAGYRGWGNTVPTTGRKTSTTSPTAAAMASGGIGIAYSEGESPTHGTISDTKSDNPLIPELNTSINIPGSADHELLGAMGPATSGNKNTNINRGASNASSFSAANGSDGSEEMSGGYSNQHHLNRNHSSGPPYETTNGRAEMAAHPVIRDVLARRNTRIESPSHFPQQSAGMSQNF